MSLDDFRASPWKKPHPAYETSAFNVKPSPEFATAEVIVASLYRAAGFANHKETDVPKSGRDFDRQANREPSGSGRISKEAWNTILHGALESPKQPKQSSKRFLQLSPVVPDVALYSGSARLAGNSWNPGALIQRMIQMGCPSAKEARGLWGRLYDALSITSCDDIWARWLQEEFTRRRTLSHQWAQAELPEIESFPTQDRDRLRYPAQQFVADLDAVIQAKGVVTRRQWISLLEAVIRVGAVMHVIWLCRLNHKLWEAMSRVLGIEEGPTVASEEDLYDTITAERRFLSYGNPAVAVLKNIACGYLVSRLGLNLVLWTLAKYGEDVQRLNSVKDLWSLLQTVDRCKKKLLQGKLANELFALRDEEIRTLTCKKGIGSNLVEFARHTLGQRLTTDDALRGYDQSYYLRKKTASRNAPWILSLGPVALLANVHCCLREARGPRSIRTLSDHLANYGIEVPMRDIATSEVGRQLRTLGLVLDSPDAESGVLLVPPFAISEGLPA